MLSQETANFNKYTEPRRPVEEDACVSHFQKHKGSISSQHGTFMDLHAGARATRPILAISIYFALPHSNGIRGKRTRSTPPRPTKSRLEPSRRIQRGFGWTLAARLRCHLVKWTCSSLPRPEKHALECWTAATRAVAQLNGLNLRGKPSMPEKASNRDLK